MKTNLSVNLNKVALLRNRRMTGSPIVLDAARVVANAGADGITVHPRPDGRHIKYSPMLAEVSVGHAITADALRLGFAGAVQAYQAAVG